MSGRPDPPRCPDELYARYLFYARADLGTAQKALQPPVSWHEACLLARECAEKALKAFMEAAGKEAPPLHGLTTLLRECIAVDKEFARFRDHCQRLSRYQEVARYPPISEYPFTEATAIEAVRLGQELFDLVTTRIERRRQAGLV